MKKVNKVSKPVGKASKKVASKAKKLPKNVKKIVAKTKVKAKVKKAKSFMDNSKKTMNDFTKQSSKTLTRAKNKFYVAEQEVVKYVKENPIKSITTLSLVALITGFVAKMKK